MTSFRIEELEFEISRVRQWGKTEPKHSDWPVVYMLNDSREVYVGETTNAATRFQQHLESEEKRRLTSARVVIDDTFNKSVCLDLESTLIRLFAGDGQYQVLNKNTGVTNANYFQREDYEATFNEVFQALRARGAFTKTIKQIESSDLFKLSPFKALTNDQAVAVEQILAGLFKDLESGLPSRTLIEGDPGTGKTVVAIYLMKVLRDIQSGNLFEDEDDSPMFSVFYHEGNTRLLTNFRIGLVIPQQSLRKSIRRVFKRTPGLDPSMVLTPFDVGQAADKFDLLIVDETHRLSQRANQPSATLNATFSEINRKLFGQDLPALTQIDWITTMSDHQLFLLDATQSVKPADVTLKQLTDLVASVPADRRYRLRTQMRISSSEDYVGYIRAIFSSTPPQVQLFRDYEFRIYDNLQLMVRDIHLKNNEHGLGRLIAGYAWEWKSKDNRAAFDIEIDGASLRWNSTQTDWLYSKSSIEEVGSIHTIQGYDLNFAGVIIGNDLRYDPRNRELYFDRRSYWDAKGKENNKKLGIIYGDEELLNFIKQIYTVLLTRGMLGTFVYVCDPDLRTYLKKFILSCEA